ncbi:MAG: hypothetical protein AB7G21_04440 [Dehalococcoidia bacterium]
MGVGAVGAGMKALFPNAVEYDEPRGIGTRSEVNACDIAFVAVPTPSRPDGGCDISIVDEVCGWIEAPVIVLRSTVPVGATDLLRERHGKRIVFQPEYGPGETPDHLFADPRSIRWVVLGGELADTTPVANLYQAVFRSDIVIHKTDARTAELAKYMENAYLAMKVTFCNEFFDVANTLNVDYQELREIWLLDPRMGRSHTWVFPDNRGFGGKCLPKDLAALVAFSTEAGYRPRLMEAVQEVNNTIRG